MRLKAIFRELGKVSERLMKAQVEKDSATVDRQSRSELARRIGCRRFSSQGCAAQKPIRTLGFVTLTLLDVSLPSTINIEQHTPQVNNWAVLEKYLEI